MIFNNQLDPRLGNWVAKNLNRVERILLIVIGIGIILKMSQLQIGTILLPIPFSTLAVLYFFRAFKVFENALATERFFNKLLSFGWAINTIGIMYLIMGWPGFDPMLIVGSFPQLVILIIILYAKEVKGVKYPTLDKSTLLRSAIIICISLSLHFCPKDELTKYKIISQPHLLDNSDK